MYLTEKGKVLESPLEPVLDCLHVVFFETSDSRACDNLTKLLRLVVHMHLHIQYTVRISDYHGFTNTFLVSSKEENTKFTFDSGSNSSKKCF